MPVVTVAAHSLHANNANPVFTTSPSLHYLHYTIASSLNDLAAHSTVISIYVNGYLTLALFQLNDHDVNVIQY